MGAQNRKEVVVYNLPTTPTQGVSFILGVTQPNFFIVGAPKCGTTALSEYLREHPRIFFCTPKEPGFFAVDLPGLRYTEELEDYERLFSSAEPQHLALGEGSPGYMFFTEAAIRIREYAPEARIIVMLRDPLDMLVSYHSQLQFSLFEDRPLSEGWALQADRREGRLIPDACREARLLQYAEMIDFAGQIKRFQQAFPKEQLLVLLFDDLRDDPVGVYERTLAFLGVPSDGRRQFPVVNARKAARSAWMNRLLHQPPRWMLWLMQKLAGTWLHDLAVRLHAWLKKANSRAKKGTERQAKYSPELEAELIKRTRPMLDELAQLIERDLSAWSR